jgi:hypothetical protein
MHRVQKNLVKGQFFLAIHAKNMTITSTIKEAQPNVGSYHAIVNLFMLLS